eukprot:scaffold25191_cov75-Phaeocystis_antarctica.AAC.1
MEISSHDRVSVKYIQETVSRHPAGLTSAHQRGRGRQQSVPRACPRTPRAAKAPRALGETCVDFHFFTRTWHAKRL